MDINELHDDYFTELLDKLSKEIFLFGDFNTNLLNHDIY